MSPFFVFGGKSEIPALVHAPAFIAKDRGNFVGG